MWVVIGCGNPVRGDDGAGPAVIAALRTRLGARAGVRLLDAGTDGMAVVYGMRGARRLDIVDATVSGSPPGTLFELPGEEAAEAPPPGGGLHDFRWPHALYVGRRLLGDAFPAEVRVHLIEAARLDYGTELSPAVAGAVARLVARLAARIEGDGGR